MSKQEVIAEFQEYVKRMPRAELGGLIKEYVAEADHGGWEGYTSRDMTGIRRFLEDLVRYHQNDPDVVGGDQDSFATRTDNVNTVP